MPYTSSNELKYVEVCDICVAITDTHNWNLEGKDGCMN